ncbi:MAG: glycosyl hydrolase family 28-related protein [Caldilineaceae bacterium]
MKRSRLLTLLLVCGFILLACQPITAPSTTQPSSPGRGATLPWLEYEAEAGQTNASILAASRTFGEIAAESSGRRSVKLSEAGHYVQFTATQPANSVVLRYVIPDAAVGGGITATLSLYVNDVFRQKLHLTSKYAWSYGGETQTLNQPSAGGAHHFFDEARALLEPIPAGATVKLQKDEDDRADYYVVDLIDLEQVAPPKSMPPDFLSITECGATPDDNSEDGGAIYDCIFKARATGKGLWIPPGTFEINRMTPDVRGFSVAELTIQGAGMWYSTLHGPFARFYCTGNNCRFYDFAIRGETILRDDKIPDNGFNGGAGSGSHMENVWVEHTKAGWWVGQGNSNVSDGLVITGSRFRNLFADGVNFCNGTSNSVVEQSHFRNTGDDAVASWAPSFDGGVNTNNVFRFNTVQLPWRANCFAIYGGKDNRIEDNLCADVVTYPGILIAQQFDAWPFSGTTLVQRNSLIRAGGPMWNQEHGALKIHAAEGALQGIVVKDLLIDSPSFSGLQIQGPHPLSATTVSNIQILNAGTVGILISPDASGQASFDSVKVSNATAGGLSTAGNRFMIERGSANQGW